MIELIAWTMVPLSIFLAWGLSSLLGLPNGPRRLLAQQERHE